jgi:muramoyltetrapeptide carboxypeptidase
MHVIFPAGPLQLEAWVDGLEVLAELGGVVAPHVLPQHDDRGAFWLAGPDEARAEALVAAVAARPSGLWMGRGGFGSARTLMRCRDRLDAIQADRPVPLWGFSDGTVLTSHWARRGWPTWSAPPVSQMARLDGASRERVRLALAGVVPAFEGLRPGRSGVAEGPLAGGNLTVLASLVGTPLMPELTGTVLVLEDVHEPAYRVDRLLFQLRISGGLDGLAGLVIGDFTEVSPRDLVGIERVILELAEDLGVPCAFGLPVGHGTRNSCLPMGRRATLTVAVDGRLEVSP